MWELWVQKHLCSDSELYATYKWRWWAIVQANLFVADYPYRRAFVGKVGKVYLSRGKNVSTSLLE